MIPLVTYRLVFLSFQAFLIICGLWFSAARWSGGKETQHPMAQSPAWDCVPGAHPVRLQHCREHRLWRQQQGRIPGWDCERSQSSQHTSFHRDLTPCKLTGNFSGWNQNQLRTVSLPNTVPKVKRHRMCLFTSSLTLDKTWNFMIPSVLMSRLPHTNVVGSKQGDIKLTHHIAGCELVGCIQTEASIPGDTFFF